MERKRGTAGCEENERERGKDKEGGCTGGSEKGKNER